MLKIMHFHKAGYFQVDCTDGKKKRLVCRMVKFMCPMWCGYFSCNINHKFFIGSTRYCG